MVEFRLALSQVRTKLIHLHTKRKSVDFNTGGRAGMDLGRLVEERVF